MALVPNDPNVDHLESTSVADLDAGTSPAGSAVGTPLGREYGETAYVATGLGTGRIFIVGRRNTGDNTPIWVEIATAAALIPDQRFTVGSAAYNLTDPGVATFTGIVAGIAAAVAGTGTTLGAPSVTSPRLVEALPATYTDNVVLAPFVGVRGMGATPADTILAPAAGDAVTISVAVADERYELENITLRRPLVITATASGSVILRDVFFDNAGATATITVTAAVGVTLDLSVESCSGTIETWSITGAGSVQLTIRGNEDGGSSFGELNYVNPIQFDTSGADNELDMVLHSVGFSGSGATLVDFAPTAVGGSYTVTLARCVIGTQATGVPFTTLGAGATYFEMQVITPIVIGIPDPWCDIAAGYAGSPPRIAIDQYVLPNDAVDSASFPMLSASGIEIDNNTPSMRGNRLHAIHHYGVGSPTDNVFEVPAAGSGVLTDYYVTDPPNPVGGGSTSQSFDAYADEHHFEANYSVLGGAINSDTTLVATLFRYAVFQLPEPRYLEDGRRYWLKNTGDPAVSTRGPVAVALPNVAAASRVDHKNSRPVANADLVASGAYYLLDPGDAIELVVDRRLNQYRVVSSRGVP